MQPALDVQSLRKLMIEVHGINIAPNDPIFHTVLLSSEVLQYFTNTVNAKIQDAQIHLAAGAAEQRELVAEQIKALSIQLVDTSATYLTQRVDEAFATANTTMASNASAALAPLLTELRNASSRYKRASLWTQFSFATCAFILGALGGAWTVLHYFAAG